MAVTPGPKRYDVGCHHFPCDDTLLPMRPAQSRRLRVSQRHLHWNLGTPKPPCLETGRENASVRAGGRRRRSSPMPACNGWDMVKVRQERRDRKTTRLHIHGEVRQGLFLNRPWTRKGGGMVNWYVAALWKAGCGKTRTSGLEGGKAAKPDLPYHSIIEPCGSPGWCGPRCSLRSHGILQAQGAGSGEPLARLAHRALDL